jgi:programmed cell death protein 5
MGQLPGKIGEAELKGLLERVSSQTSQKTTVKFDRRRNNLDSDDDD